MFRKINRSKLAVCIYYVQVAVLSPILIPIALVYLMSNRLLAIWSCYKEWHLYHIAKL